VGSPTFRQHGWPIGSEPVESAGRHLVRLRVKRAGARDCVGVVMVRDGDADQIGMLALKHLAVARVATHVGEARAPGPP
jgi:hypothetical protein